MLPRMTADLQPQEWALVAEALVSWAGNPNEIDDPREQRAYEIVEEIAAQLGCWPSELVLGCHLRYPQ